MPIRAVARVETMEIEYFLENGEHVYSMDLERCRTSADLLDWILQLSGKTWLSHEDLGLVVRAIDELLCPQGLLCGDGVEKGPVAVERIRERVVPHDGVDMVALVIKLESGHTEH